MYLFVCSLTLLKLTCFIVISKILRIRFNKILLVAIQCAFYKKTNYSQNLKGMSICLFVLLHFRFIILRTILTN